MTEWQAFVLAFLMDLVIGDPRWLPHPVQVIGSGIARCESFLRRPDSTPSGLRRSGVALALIIVLSVLGSTLLIEKALLWCADNLSVVLGSFFLVYLVSATIATRGLIESAGLVMGSVKKGDLPGARRHLSMVVGRDTEGLSEKQVLTAVMETLAENLSDGVVAPIFYFVLGGLPLAMAYKAVNTLDSMVGYKNESYIHLGWASARLDDMANYIPARITGILIVVSVFTMSLFRHGPGAVATARRAFRIMRRDGRNHTSPNSGIPEAAMAGAIGIRMGGTSFYGGVPVPKPYIGKDEREDWMAAAEEEVRVVAAASVLAGGLAAACLYFKGMA